MKKECIFLFTICCFFSIKTYANNINQFLNTKLENNFTSLKKNVESACVFENPYNKKCMSYSTQFNEYFISRGNFSVEYNTIDTGKANTIVLCHITKNKLKYVPHVYSTDKSFLEQEEHFEYQYNLKFSWYLQSYAFSSKKYFYILNKKVQIEFSPEQQTLDTQLDKLCIKEITEAISLLNGVPLT